MKKTIKWLLIISVFILLLKLYWHPKWNSELPESISVSKKAGAFLWEYRIDRIDTIDSSYGFPVFKNIWATKWCRVKRNKLGMIHLVADKSSNNHICFDIHDQDTFFDKNKGRWCWNNDKDFFEYPYGPSDTVYYTIYRMKEEYSHAPENLIPLFKMTLIPK